MKDILVVGDSLDFITSVVDYPASAGYTLKHRLVPRSSGTAIEITASASGDDYETQVAAATTATWTAGEYSWFAWVEKAGERWQVDSGTCTLQINPATSSAYDGRSVAERALEDARTALANFSATGGRVKSYSIAGRSMEFDAAADILKLVTYWQAEVMRERGAKAARDGLPDPRRISIRMSNA